MAARDFDLIVIGAGIHGAGVAQAAAAAGHSVLVIEREAAAAGTSSRSSKLIHGGLRYLEQLELGLVRECLRERALLLRLAPQLVRLVPFRVPVYAGMRRGPWTLRSGLLLYSALGGFASYTRFKALPDATWRALDGLANEGLEAVFEYQDGQTDDTALTRAVLASACALGAITAMPARVGRVVLDADGARVTYMQGDARVTASARVVVNAAGPWLNRVLALVTPAQPPADVELVRGTHIELPERGLGAVYYLEAPQDGRAVLVMPRPGHTLVGTTERTHADPDAVAPEDGELDYLLDAVRTRFPAWSSAGGLEVRAAWSGLRVLPRGQGAAFARSRETVLVTDRERSPRMLTICGGKLTSYRATAERVVRRLAPALPRVSPRADTRELRLEPA